MRGIYLSGLLDWEAFVFLFLSPCCRRLRWKPNPSCLQNKTKFTIATLLGKAEDSCLFYLYLRLSSLHLPWLRSHFSPETQWEGGEEAEADESCSLDAPVCVIVSIFQWQRCVKWKLDRAGCSQTWNFIQTSGRKEGGSRETERCQEGGRVSSGWLHTPMAWVSPTSV